MNGRGAKRRSVSSGPSGASGGSTTLSREPSARRASTIGWASSSRRPGASGQAHAGVAQRARIVEAQAPRAAAGRAARPRPRAGPFDDHLRDARIVEQRRRADRGAAATESAPAGLSSAAAALSCARSQRLIAVRPARRGRRTLRPAAPDRARGHAARARPASRSRAAASPVCSASACAALRLARPRGDDAGEARREAEPRDQQRLCAARRGLRAHPRSRR